MAHTNTSSKIMKNLSVVALFALLSQSFAKEGSGTFSEEFGHVEPSCVGKKITKRVTLDDLIQEQKNDGDNNKPTVSVECGCRATVEQGKTYNLPNGLIVYGELKFKDSKKSKNETMIVAPYILVRGHLQAGTLEKPFLSKLRFVLTEFPKDNKNEKRTLKVKELSKNPYFAGETMDFGDKAFVVYGGTISLTGPSEGKKIFATLAKTVTQGSTKIFVKGDWTKYWKTGDHLVITATNDIRGAGNVGQAAAKEFTLKSNSKKKKNKTKLSLSENFVMNTNDASNFAAKKVKTRTHTGKKKYVLMAAEVYKLTRNIVIQGIPAESDMADFIGTDYRTVKKTNPNGGHFIIAHTPKKQIIQGVEFSAMGQLGIIGRYPLHFHSCGDIDKQTIVKHNSIHHSKHRCVVVHATNGLTIQQNAAFWADDHCYMTEDGYEHSNVFTDNIAANIKKAAFWMANPSNDLINNVAANANFGFEIAEVEVEDRDNFSYKNFIPCQKQVGGLGNDHGCIWPRLLPLGIFNNNQVHNVNHGIQIYPPRMPEYPLKTDTMDTMQNFFAWHVSLAYNSITYNMIIKRFLVIGAGSGLRIDLAPNVLIKESVFQNVCIGVSLSDRNLWNTMHSGALVTNVVFVNILKYSQCAPIVFEQVTVDDDNESYTKVSTQIKDVKLYNVAKLFAFNNRNSIRQYGFFVHNVESFDSDLKDIAPASDFNDEYQPSYIIRHGYSNNQIIIKGDDSLISDCETLNYDEFFLCKGQCWRPVAIIFDKGKGSNDMLKFVTENGNVFYLKETEVQRPCGGGIHFIQVIPSGKYKISVVDSNMKELTGKRAYDTVNVRFYYIDQPWSGFEDSLGCSDKISLEFNKNIVPESDFKACNGYYPM